MMTYTDLAYAYEGACKELKELRAENERVKRERYDLLNSLGDLQRSYDTLKYKLELQESIG